MIDIDRVRAACERQAARPVAGVDDMAAYLARQVSDESHREVLGPLPAGSGASGVVVHCGQEVGSWGGPAVPEMLFSAASVGETLPLVTDDLRWVHLLQQASQWNGELWGKPADVDGAQVPVVSGEAHWGGGLFMSARDLALVGELHRTGGRHLLWVDPERKLVIASHWGEDVERLICAVSAAVSS